MFVLAGAAVILILSITIALAVPAIVRALPGRYAYYLPEPLKAWRHNPHPITLPTPQTNPTPTPEPSRTSTSTATSTSTPVPSLTPTPPPAPTDTPTATATPSLPTSAMLGGVRHEHQGWNNCGPTTLSMALSYWGYSQTQNDIAPIVKPDPEDKNVSPNDLTTYAESLGLETITRVDGDLHLLKRLLANDFPVIVETWYVRDAEDQLGHYRLLVGYDDEAQHFITYDSLHGPDVLIGYQELDELWRVFNRIYLVLYPQGRAGDLGAILGPDRNEEYAIQQALETARVEVNQQPETVAYADPADWQTFAWFNAGSSLTALGRYDEATGAFDQARARDLHHRMLWYQFAPYRAYYEVGRYEDVISLATFTLNTASNLEESYYWRAKARAAQGDVEGARSDLEQALRYHEGWQPALTALEELENSTP